MNKRPIETTEESNKKPCDDKDNIIEQLKKQLATSEKRDNDAQQLSNEMNEKMMKRVSDAEDKSRIHEELHLKCRYFKKRCEKAQWQMSASKLTPSQKKTSTYYRRIKNRYEQSKKILDELNDTDPITSTENNKINYKIFKCFIHKDELYICLDYHNTYVNLRYVPPVLPTFGGGAFGGGAFGGGAK